MDPHRLAELRSLSLHRAIGEELRRRPEIVEAARRRLEEPTNGRSTARAYRDEWLAILALPIARIIEVIVADDERGRELRQTTPFTGVIGPRERWRLWRETREQT